jgi:hypothetical protein
MLGRERLRRHILHRKMLSYQKVRKNSWNELYSEKKLNHRKSYRLNYMKKVELKNQNVEETYIPQRKC